MTRDLEDELRIHYKYSKLRTRTSEHISLFNNSIAFNRSVIFNCAVNLLPSDF